MDNQTEWLRNYLDDLPEDFHPLESAVDSLVVYASKTYGYESKNTRIREWNPDRFQCYNFVTKVFMGCLLHPEGMTYQAMIGYVSGQITCAKVLDRAKCAAECIALIYQNSLITITKISPVTMMITTEYALEEKIPELEKHLPKFIKPGTIQSNSILGNRFKQHGDHTCNQHIDNMNTTRLCLETRLLGIGLEQPKDVLDSLEEQQQWKMFTKRSEDMYRNTLNHGNNFYLKHAYDTRGRCYCEGYYINYQGSSFKKAIVQLADKEVVNLTN